MKSCRFHRSTTTVVLPGTMQQRPQSLDEKMPLFQRKKRRRDEAVQLRSITPTTSGRSLPPTRVTSPMVRLAVYCSVLLLLVSFANGLQVFHGSAMVVGRVTFDSRRTATTTTLRQAFSSIQSSTFISSTAILKSQFDNIPNCIQQSSLSSFGTIPSPWWSPFLQPMQHFHHQQQRGFMTMGKGDGKKKRPKQTSDSALSSSSSSSSGASSSSSSLSSSVPKPKPTSPLRVSTNINIPVKHQIMYAKFNKQVSEQASPGYVKKKVERTKYRRTWDEEEIEEKAEERRRKGQDPDWDVILNRTASSPLVIVDGYNIIHHWPRLKKHMIKGDTQRARELLVDDLENLRSIKGWRIEVVFDGAGRVTKGPLGDGPRGSTKVTAGDRATNKEVSKYGVRVVFTGAGVEADSYIEARCAKAKNVTSGELTGSFIVATDDAMIRLAGQSAGAWCMGATRFVEELKAMKKAMEYRVEAAVAKVNGHAIRPEKLRGTSLVRFGRGSVIVEDRRNRTKTVNKQANDNEEEPVHKVELNLKVDQNETGIPWWAQVPNQTVVFRNGQSL